MTAVPSPSHQNEQMAMSACHVHLVFFVLPGVGEAGDDGGDARWRGDLAGVNHDEQLHQVVVDLAAAALHDVHVLAAHALPDLYTVDQSEMTRDSSDTGACLRVICLIKQPLTLKPELKELQSRNSHKIAVVSLVN